MRPFLATMLGVFVVTFAIAWLSGAMSAGTIDPGHNADRGLAPVYALICTAVAAATWIVLIVLSRARKAR